MAQNILLPISQFFFWRNERFIQQILTGIHYQIPSAVVQPICLLGLNLGNEWYQYKLKILEIPAGKEMQLTDLKKEMQGLVIFPSITFIREWKLYNLFFQLRYGGYFIYSHNSNLKQKQNYAQFLIGVLFKLI